MTTVSNLYLLNTDSKVYRWMEDTKWDNENDIVYEKSTGKLLTGIVLGRTFRTEYVNGKKSGLSITSSDLIESGVGQEKRFLDGVGHGLQRSYWCTGFVAEEYTLKNGLLHGSFKKMSDKGIVQIDRNYHEGMLHGKEIYYQAYFDDDNTMIITNWKYGKKHGKRFEWFARDFKLKSESTYDEDKKDGFQREWYLKSGRLKFEKTYSKGKLLSSKRWDIEGNLLK